MRRLDRYVLAQVLPAFLMGMGLFAALILSFDQIYNALKKIYQEGVPGLLVVESLFYQMPGVLAMTLPMATMFASLTSLARMSADGEITAMRAGGIGLTRIIRSVLVFGLCVSIFGLALNEIVVPYCNWHSKLVLMKQVEKGETSIKFDIPKDGPLERSVYARRFSIAEKRLDDVTITQYREGKFWQLISADRAVWQGQKWVLYNILHQWEAEDGTRRTERIDRASYRIGKTPDELLKNTMKTEDMTLPEVKALVAERMASDNFTGVRPGTEAYQTLYREHILPLLLEINLRLAMPFAAFGLALMAAPLGLRPQRTSKSVGFGLSLAVVFGYYIVFQIVRMVAEQGAIPPALAAWTGNIILFLVGIGLLVEKSR